MLNKSLNKTFIISIIYFLVYFTSAIFQSNFWGNLLSPIGALLSAFIIFHSYLKTDRSRFFKIWLIFGLADLSWAFADILWAYDDLILHYNPQNNDLISILYLGTNIFIFIATFIYCLYKFKSLNGVQLFIDSIFISVSILWLIWIFIFDKQFYRLGMITHDSIINLTAILIDTALIIGVSVWYLSIRGGKISTYMRVISGSILVFAICDLYYFYLYIKNLYVPNSIIDSIYILALFGISIGIKIVYETASSIGIKYDSYSNVGYGYKSLLLFQAPLLIIIFKGLDIPDLIFYTITIFLYEGFSSYIQASIKNQELLKRELQLNAELERRIYERTKELYKRTKELEEKNRQLDFLSNHDTLTKLFNRRYFVKTIDEKLNNLQKSETLAVMFMDIDRFKTINDTYGHSVGDKILISLSERLLNFEKKPDILARFGGDEFVFAYQGNYSYIEVQNIAQEIIENCSKPIEIQDHVFKITVSVGISICPLDAKDSSTLLKNADIAMYQAKKLGFNNCVSFNDEFNAFIQNKHQIEIYLKKANFEKEFMLYYQPQFSIPDNKLIGCEALLRWNCPGIGFISPSEFVPIAEETDLIVPIGRWVMEKAISQIAKWNNKYNMNLKVGINVSPKQLYHPNFVEILKSMMEFYSALPSWIDIEITEGVAITEEFKVSQIAKYFKNIGITISIDDFGTGYSSMNYLKIFPFDTIKIAKPLIDGITNDKYNQEIVNSIIKLANSLHIKTIAEGVESLEQLSLLSSLGCDQIQGYYLGTPSPAEVFEANFLKNQLIEEVHVNAVANE